MVMPQSSVRESLAVTRELLSDEVALRLRALIRDGQLPAGTRLIETALSEMLRVSRGPVREALRTLEREGLVVIAPHKGAVVAEWDLSDLLDAYDVRAILEIKAMTLATERGAEACVAELSKVLASWATAVEVEDRERCADLDFEFHRIIWRAANNRVLSATLDQTIHPLQTIFYLNATRYDDLLEVVMLHRRMCDAIATGDPAEAQAAMEAHMENSLRKARQHSDTASV